MTRRHDTVYIHVQAKQRKKENDHILHIFSKKTKILNTCMGQIMKCIFLHQSGLVTNYIFCLQCQRVLIGDAQSIEEMKSFLCRFVFFLCYVWNTDLLYDL